MSGPLRPRLAAAIGRLPGVEAATVVATGTLWLRRTFSRTGSAVSRAPPGYAIPMDVAAVTPTSYSRVVGPAARTFVGPLRRGRAVLSVTSAELRRVGRGALLGFTNGQLRVGAVASDVSVGAHEAMVARGPGREIGITQPSYVLIRVSQTSDPGAIGARIRHLVGGTPFRVRSGARSPYLRRADGVLPPEWEKVYFGEFAARAVGGGTFQLDPVWVRRHVVTARVPLLGTVRCNRNLMAPFRRAVRALRRSGLRSLVRRSDYGGCFVPRVVRGGSGLSHHTWGSAIDLNVSTNRLGAPPHQDPRLVRAFARAGFVWGGRFLRPDGMHFEFGCPAALPTAGSLPAPVRLLELPLCRGG
jgi:D-alanyl-D-alanine carboxypeptidase